MSGKKKLLYRDDIRSDEILPDYMERLSHHNGFGSAQKFAVWLKKLDVPNAIPPGERSSRQSVFQHKCHTKLQNLLEREIPRDNLNWNISLNSLYQTHYKICRKCFDEDYYYRFYWRLSGYQQCHIHKIALETLSGSPFKSRLRIRSSFNNHEENTHVDQYIVRLHQEKCDMIRSVSETLDEVDFERRLIAIIVNLCRIRIAKNFSGDDALRSVNRGKLLGLPHAIRIERLTSLFSRENQIDWRVLFFIIYMVCLSIKIYRRQLRGLTRRYTGSIKYQDWAVQFLCSLKHTLVIDRTDYNNEVASLHPIHKPKSEFGSHDENWQVAYEKLIEDTGLYWGVVYHYSWKIFYREDLAVRDISFIDVMGFEKRVENYLASMKRD